LEFVQIGFLSRTKIFINLDNRNIFSHEPIVTDSLDQAIIFDKKNPETVLNFFIEMDGNLSQPTALPIFSEEEKCNHFFKIIDYENEINNRSLFCIVLYSLSKSSNADEKLQS
jgi:tetrahydromethanopterin S-methyltransferase subunit H